MYSAVLFVSYFPTYPPCSEYFLVNMLHQGLQDQFYAQLNPALFKQMCAQVGQSLTLREHVGYDHGYYFIQSFIDEHLQFHIVQLEH